MVAAAHNPPRILVVDDEPDIAESFCDLLRSLVPGVMVNQALAGREALQKLREGPVDLIVTDFMMPGMNGIQFLREAERVAPGVPNILVTAFEADMVRKAGGPAPDRILHKPFDIGEFQVAVSDALGST